MEKVIVEWIDAFGGNYQQSVEELENIKPLIVTSIGYLLFKNKEYVCLGFTLYNDNDIKHWQFIPKSLIQKIKRIK